MTLLEALDRAVGEADDDRRIIGPDLSLSYRAFSARVDAAAAVLASHHAVRPGDRICYLGYNSVTLLILIFAAARIGSMVCPLNWRLADEELAWIVGNAEPRLMLADPAHEGRAAGIVQDGLVVPVEALHDAPEHAAPDLGQPAAGTPLLLVYTSGATGRPKGALLSQDAVLANARLSWDMHAMSAGDHILTALPMFHVGGLNIQTLPALLMGARVTVMERFEPAACQAVIRDRRPTLTVQVPATFQSLMSHSDWESTDFASLRAIATGSTDVPVPMIEAVHRKGVPVIQIYGATETGPVVVYQKAEQAVSHLGSIGRAGEGVEVRITAPDGTPVDDTEVGEIWLRSPTLASGYWRNPEAEAAFADGWFRTGDMARRDPDGFLWFADRLKNLIISGGENIYPAEIERVIATLPGVKEVSVVGRADQKWGQVPVAVLSGNGQIGRDHILCALEGRLARFKHPKDVVFVEALPRNAMGKVLVEAVKALANA